MANSVQYECLRSVNALYSHDLRCVFEKVLSNGAFILSHEVQGFEQDFSRYIGCNFCIGTGNGLDALEIGFQSLKLDPGSKVLVSAHTYIATVLAILNVGLEPVLVEPYENTMNISVEELQRAYTPDVKAVCVTHMYGKPCRMDEITDFCKTKKLKLIEDCAQAHGAMIGDRKVGSWGNFSAFSFYPTKNLGALGDGGAITTGDDEIANFVRKFRNYGSSVRYHNEIIGRNSRLDELQAAILRVKLRGLDQLIVHKRRLADIYFARLPAELTLPHLVQDEFDVFHIFAIRYRKRDSLRAFLEENGVQTAIHYPVPPHKQPALASFSACKLPITERIHAEEISLPISLAHSEDQIHYICDLVNEYFHRGIGA